MGFRSNEAFSLGGPHRFFYYQYVTETLPRILLPVIPVPRKQSPFPMGLKSESAFGWVQIRFGQVDIRIYNVFLLD